MIPANPSRKVIAAFDFDGTLTSGDTMLHFIRFARGASALLISFLALLPDLLAYKTGLDTNESAKKKLLRWHFKGISKEEWQDLGRRFCKEKLPELIRRQGMERIQWHRSRNHRVVVVSSSLSIWVKPWCDEMDLPFIGTEPAYDNSVFNGEFATPNCYGAEKVKRLRAVFSANEYDSLLAYGDSRGDRELLEFASQSWFRPFR